MKAQVEWLTARADNPPTSYDGGAHELAGLRARMAWQKLKQKAREGDEIWAFSNPARKQGKQAGFAIVRDGTILDSVFLAP